MLIGVQKYDCESESALSLMHGKDTNKHRKYMYVLFYSMKDAFVYIVKWEQYHYDSLVLCGVCYI